MEYLKNMSNEELKELIKENKIVLLLGFTREKAINKLIKRGYKYTEEDVQEVVKYNKEKEINGFTGYIKLNMRSQRFYRNYINKKKIRKLKKRYRYRKDEFKDIKFTDYEINPKLLKLKELELEKLKSKFDLGSVNELKEEKESIYFDRAPIPDKYYKDEIILMPKNTTTLFAYWEICDDTYKRLQLDKNIIDRVVIKLMKNGSEYLKFQRDERIGSHYINEVDVNESYEAIIGYEDKFGNFIEVAHSTESISPRNKISNNTEMKWLTVYENPKTGEIVKCETKNIEEVNLITEEKQLINTLIDIESYEKHVGSSGLSNLSSVNLIKNKN